MYFPGRTGGAPCQIKGNLDVTTAAMNGGLLTAQSKAVERCNALNAAVPISTGPISGYRDVAGGQVPQVEGEVVRAGDKNNGNNAGRGGNVRQQHNYERLKKRRTP
jgi:hypothetical protein